MGGESAVGMGGGVAAQFGEKGVRVGKNPEKCDGTLEPDNRRRGVGVEGRRGGGYVG